VIEIDSLDECAAWLAIGDDRPPAAFRALDLRDASGFESGSFEGCLFLSCVLTPAQAGFLTTTGATVLRDDPRRPFTAHRTRLYSVEELYAGFDPDAPPDATGGYESTFDAQVYAHWAGTGRQNPPMIDESLARRLHDHSITEALDDQLVGRRPVAVMGGHGMERASADYAQIARVARSLARSGHLMLSGGGPGAMEATHLGVWMAHFDDAELDAAIAVLAPRPAGAGAGAGREYADADWLHRAFAVRRRWPLRDEVYLSVGIPTWMYGHEPPAAFATSIAKYFANSVREEGLLAVATHGVVFAPGSAGTIQEIFQDTTQNHYASYGPASPMILLGTEHWTTTHPVWPLLQSLAADHGYRDLITLTDDERVAIEHIERYERREAGVG
jgi:predicted Rossmann-fold nucleotide-binding protein